MLVFFAGCFDESASNGHALLNKATSLRTLLFTAKPVGWGLLRFTPPTPHLLLPCFGGHMVLVSGNLSV